MWLPLFSDDTIAYNGGLLCAKGIKVLDEEQLAHAFSTATTVKLLEGKGDGPCHQVTDFNYIEALDNLWPADSERGSGGPDQHEAGAQVAVRLPRYGSRLRRLS